MWTAIAAALSFVGAMLGVFIQGRNLKRQLQQAHDNLKQSIDAQATALKQQLAFEGKRDKRTIYAAALATLKKFEIDKTNDNETAARVAVWGVALVAQPDVWKTAQSLLEALCRMPGTSTDRASQFRDLSNRMVRAMRTDLGVNDPWQPAAPNSPTWDGNGAGERVSLPVPGVE